MSSNNSPPSDSSTQTSLQDIVIGIRHILMNNNFSEEQEQSILSFIRDFRNELLKPSNTEYTFFTTLINALRQVIFLPVNRSESFFIEFVEADIWSDFNTVFESFKAQHCPPDCKIANCSTECPKFLDFLREEVKKLEGGSADSNEKVT
ncbi:MAG: hypothetical protein ACFFD4_40095 [Candidatus Odinarchaeota archaeon]